MVAEQGFLVPYIACLQYEFGIARSVWDVNKGRQVGPCETYAVC